MQAQIENLVKLQAIDLERTRLTAALRDLPHQVAQGEAALAAAERRAAEASGALANEETLRTRLEREVATHRQKAARLRAQLDNVTTPAQVQAIEHEIEFVSGEADRLDNEAFASLERSETQDTALTGARTQIEEETEALAKIRARAATRKLEYEGELAKHGSEREAVRLLISQELLVRYDRLATTRGTGLAKAESQRCSSCLMGIRPQTWNQLREGELLTCDSCGRLLYWDPAIVAGGFRD